MKIYGREKERVNYKVLSGREWTAIIDRNIYIGRRSSVIRAKLKLYLRAEKKATELTVKSDRPAHVSRMRYIRLTERERKKKELNQRFLFWIPARGDMNDVLL